MKRLILFSLVAILAVPLVAATPLEDPPVYQLQWGSWGTAPGEFKDPRGVAADAEGNVYVADTGNHRIQVFTADGDFLRQWSVSDSPRGIAVSGAGLVYVTRTFGVVVFSPTGTAINQWGGLGTNPGQVALPSGIAVNSAGEVYVGDTGNNRVQKFSSDGTLITLWGSGAGQFLDAYGIALDSQGNVYVADGLNGRIQKFDSDGAFLTAWSTGLNSPVYVAVDHADNVYVTDVYLNQCLKFTSDGTPILAWGSSGTGPGQFRVPRGIAIDGLGHIFVADEPPNTAYARIQRFGSLATSASPGSWGALKARYR
jgi:DNA-binding beta-propeller fold protein YncE